MKKISYIFPIYNESGNIKLLHSTISSLIEQNSNCYSYELIFINDGSKDNSLDELIEIQKVQIEMMNDILNQIKK